MKITVILNSPNDPLNIGSVVRSMTNLGFSDLRLVAPRNYDEHRVGITACNSRDKIANIKIYESIESATQDINEIVGFTARHGRHRGTNETGTVDTLPNWITEIKNSKDISVKRVALMFGSEDNGLTHEDISWCTKLLTIPTAGDYSSFNLAQAVTISLYSMFVYLEGNISFSPDYIASEDIPDNFKLADGSQFQQLEKILYDVLERIGFLKSTTPTPIPLLIRRIFRRATPTVRELKVVIGIFGRVNRALNGQVPTDDTKPE